MDFENVDLNGGNVEEQNSKSIHFSFLRFVKIEPVNKIQSFFKKEMPLLPIHDTTLLSISFTSLIKMESTIAYITGMDLSSI